MATTTHWTTDGSLPSKRLESTSGIVWRLLKRPPGRAGSSRQRTTEHPFTFVGVDDVFGGGGEPAADEGPVRGISGPAGGLACRGSRDLGERVSRPVPTGLVNLGARYGWVLHQPR